jgi:hypothetical protein
MLPALARSARRRTATAKDARRIARRFLNFEDLILRFATRPDLDIFTNNEAEVRHEVARGEWAARKEGRLMMAAG